MSADDQVVFVLQLIVAVGPLAVYFLALGLLNSQPYPCLLKLRTDFSLLSIAFFPLIMMPCAAALEYGWRGVSVGVGAALAFVLLWRAWPRPHSGWVVYNIDEGRGRELVDRVCRRLGWETVVEGDRIRVVSPYLVLRIKSFSLLRNLTLRMVDGDERSNADASERLERALEQDLRAEALLPSPAGAGLVLTGVALLGLPMWYLVHHMDAVVEVFRRIFLV